MPINQARRVYSLFMQFPEIVQRIKKVEQAIEELGTEEKPE
jgi:hypothetical protein